ncbi:MULTISPECIES: hypothetical protein [unclassified Caballeronia]|uniref:hypothetical protein n=1 Tax=unclassified Caballeronia TaxID=2646786 RepID=UPI00202917A5|nr:MULTISPECIES: hypothetical protein [unclassified Caballeronia]
MGFLYASPTPVSLLIPKWFPLLENDICVGDVQHCLMRAIPIGRTLERMREGSVVLAVQDTTDFNLTHLHATEGLGHCAGHNHRGFMMHSMLAVTPEGLPLGVLGMKTWTRTPEERGKGELRRRRTIREKESAKWLEGLEHLSTLKAHCPQTHCIGICDREGDIYDVFKADRPAGVNFRR